MTYICLLPRIHALYIPANEQSAAFTAVGMPVQRLVGTTYDGGR